MLNVQILSVLLMAKKEDKKHLAEYVQGKMIDTYKELKETDYPNAIKNFDQVEQQFPYSLWAERAQIMMAYTQYLQNEYTDSFFPLPFFLSVS